MIYLNFCFKYFIFLFLNFYYIKTKIIFKRICSNLFKNIYFNKILEYFILNKEYEIYLKTFKILKVNWSLILNIEI